ncbi:MAG: hypothetical protein IKO36_00585 [Bacteroidaceae bacterium]|nr:hypothetical protein [Bacteroidaceae bacterium]
MNNKKLLKIVIAVILLFILCAACTVVIYNHPSTKPSLEPDNDASDWQGKQELPNSKTDIKQIAIPGIESLVFISGQKTQHVNFYNPKENSCLIVFSLHIDDKEYWRSGYCAPEKGYYTIELSEPLETGTYNAELLHECYKQDGTPLNSANIRFSLIVQEE